MGVLEFAAYYYLGTQLPSILLLGAVAIGGAVYFVKNSASSIANQISETADSYVNANRSAAALKESFDLVNRSPDLVKDFKSMSNLDQSAHVSRWLETSADLPAEKVQSIGDCIRHYASSRNVINEPLNNFTKILSFANRFSEQLGNERVSSILNYMIGPLGAPGAAVYFTPKTVEAVAEAPSNFSKILEPHHLEALKNYMVSAVVQGATNASDAINGKGCHTTDFKDKIAVIDALYLPTYAHNGLKRTAAISIQNGNYTADQRKKIQNGAETIIAGISSELDKGYSQLRRSVREGEYPELQRLIDAVKANSAAGTSSAIPAPAQRHKVNGWKNPSA